MLPIEQACFWMSQKRVPPQAPLTQELRADIVIIGGGFTGLWTAVFLKDLSPAIEVVILEHGCVG